MDGGLPVDNPGGREEIMDLFDPAGDKAVSHTRTFNGSPMVMEAGLAAIQHPTPSAITHINSLGDRCV